MIFTGRISGMFGKGSGKIGIIPQGNSCMLFKFAAEVNSIVEECLG